MKAWRVLVRKELLDVVRDRRTLAVSIVVPVLLYPGLLALMGVVIAAGTQRLKNETLTVAVVGQHTQALLDTAPPPAKTQLVLHTREEAEALLKAQTIAAAVQAPESSEATLRDGRQAVVQVLYTRRFDRSMEALERLRPVLEGINAKTLAVRLEAQRLDQGFVQPLKIEAVDLEFQKDLGPLIASRLLPIILVMMLILGALYPAVDLTAGEKERGTLETLLVASVRPVDVMAAKYLTVSAVAVATALANLGAMGLTFGAGLALGGTTLATFRLTAGQVLTMLVCVVPTALLLSGVALAVSSLARTFKEGQSLMTPVLLVCLAPALLSQMPGIELNHLTALVPLLNMSLLVKATVLGNAEPLDVALSAASVMVCALLALRVAASAFNSELFRFGGTEALKALLSFKR